VFGRREYSTTVAIASGFPGDFDLKGLDQRRQLSAHDPRRTGFIVHASGPDLLNKAGRNGPVPPFVKYVVDPLLAKSIPAADVPYRPTVNEIKLDNTFGFVVPGVTTPEPHHLRGKSHRIPANRRAQVRITAEEEKLRCVLAPGRVTLLRSGAIESGQVVLT